MKQSDLVQIKKNSQFDFEIKYKKMADTTDKLQAQKLEAGQTQSELNKMQPLPAPHDENQAQPQERNVDEDGNENEEGDGLRNDNLSIFFLNLQHYCTFLLRKDLPQQHLSQLQQMLLEMLQQIWFGQLLPIDPALSDCTPVEGYNLYRNLDEYEKLLRELNDIREHAQSEEQFDECQSMINKYLSKIEEIIQNQEETIRRFEELQVSDEDEENGEEQEYKQNEQNNEHKEQNNEHQKQNNEQKECKQEQHSQNNTNPKENQNKLDQRQTRQVQERQEEEMQKDGTSQIDIPASHFFQEQINCNIDYSPQVFSSIRPTIHQIYLSQAAKVYHQIAPIKIKHIMLSSSTQVDAPLINRKNYFDPSTDQAKVLIGYCVPHTNTFGYYLMSDICKELTLSKQFYHQKQLANQWKFSTQTRSVVTPSGKIYAINCKTSATKLDSYLYEIGQSKASNRGPLPSPKRDASLIYLNNSLYLIGGHGEGEKCSKKAFKYTLKDKKWHNLSECNIALNKPTLCALNSRYILKMGGLNQFDYISKGIQLYDSVTDKWSLVRATPRNIMEEVQILEDSLAVQISDDQVYIFGGKNGNRFRSDTGFVLMISEIREKKRGASKVSGQFWNVSIGKRNLLTFFGDYSQANVIIHHNCIYMLRTSYAKALAP